MGRAFLIIMDFVGIGGAPDAGTNTPARIAAHGQGFGLARLHGLGAAIVPRLHKGASDAEFARHLLRLGGEAEEGSLTFAGIGASVAAHLGLRLAKGTPLL